MHFSAVQITFHGEIERIDNKSSQIVVHRSIREIFQIPERKSNLIILVFSFANSCFSFYLMSYNVKYFFGDIITNGVILGVADIIAALIGKFTLD